MALRPPDNRFYGKILDCAQAVLIAWFPALIAFVLIPFDLYLPNQEDFSFNIALVFPFLLISLLWLILLMPLVWASGTFRTRFCMPLFYLGIFLALTDLILPVAAHVNSANPHAKSFLDVAVPVCIELAIAAGLFICFKKVSFEKIKTGAGAFVAILLATQMFSVPGRLSSDTIVVVDGRVLYDFATRTAKHRTSCSRFNIYHITLDGFGSSVFAEAVNKGNLRERLDGFTFFQRTRANYIWTNYSMASYLTGTFYQKGSVGEWMERRKTRGLMMDLTDAGYYLTLYIPIRYYIHKHAARVIDTVDVMSKHGNPGSIFGISDFLDLWLARVIPRGLWDLVELGRNGPRSGSFSHGSAHKAKSRNHDDEVSRFLQDDRSSDLMRKRWIRKIYNSLPLMSRFISDEEKRPNHGQYVYLHTYISHEPHDVLDADCHVVGGTRPQDQAACSLKFVMEFIAKLKELDRYHGSAIILQADHGSSIIGPTDPDLRMPEQVIDDVISVTRFPEDLLNNRTFPMLAIKPPNTSGSPMITSQSPVQLADIPATVLEMLGLEGVKGVGRSVFSVRESEEREIHMFLGFARKNKKGHVQWGGKQLLSGELSHISFINGKGYKKYPHIPFNWN